MALDVLSYYNGCSEQEFADMAADGRAVGPYLYAEFRQLVTEEDVLRDVDFSLNEPERYTFSCFDNLSDGVAPEQYAAEAAGRDFEQRLGHFCRRVSLEPLPVGDAIDLALLNGHRLLVVDRRYSLFVRLDELVDDSLVDNDIRIDKQQIVALCGQKSLDALCPRDLGRVARDEPHGEVIFVAEYTDEVDYRLHALGRGVLVDRDRYKYPFHIVHFSLLSAERAFQGFYEVLIFEHRI